MNNKISDADNDDIFSKISDETVIEERPYNIGLQDSLSEVSEEKSIVYNRYKVGNLSTYFCFTKNRKRYITSSIKPSKKCTNLVKYKNIRIEPTLRNPIKKSLLLGKCKVTLINDFDDKFKTKSISTSVSCHIVRFNSDTLIQTEAPLKLIENHISPDECERITDTIFQNIFLNTKEIDDNVIPDKLSIKQLINNIYEPHLTLPPLDHAAKILFRQLIRRFSMKTSNASVGSLFNDVNSVDCQYSCVTVDKKNSTFITNTFDKETQYDFDNRDMDIQVGSNKIAQIIKKSTVILKAVAKKTGKDSKSDNIDQERRIQELEQLLKNTVYLPDNVKRRQSIEKDIEITKILINNLDASSKQNELLKSVETLKVHQNPSVEIPKIQETINHIIKETELPADVAKEFLNTYLDVLVNDDVDRKNSLLSMETNTNTLVANSPQLTNMIATPRVYKNDSNDNYIIDYSHEYNSTDTPVNITNGNNDIADTDNSASNINTYSTNNNKDNPGETYATRFLDKLTKLFAKVNIDTTQPQEGENVNITSIEPKTNTVPSKYKLENVAVTNDPQDESLVSVTIKLRKNIDGNIYKEDYLNLNFSQNKNNAYNKKNNKATQEWISHLSVSSSTSKDTLVDDDIEEIKINYEECGCVKDITSINTLYERLSESEFDALFDSIASDTKQTVKYSTQKDPACYMLSTLKTKRHYKKKPIAKDKGYEPIIEENDFYSKLDRNVELALLKRAKPDYIDEKFILLLLENLSLLAENVPIMSKDISALYQKLKKRQERMTKTYIPGVSLLGKIYDSDYFKIYDRFTQVEFSENQVDKMTQTRPPVDVEHKCVCTDSRKFNHVATEPEIVNDLKPSNQITTIPNPKDNTVANIPSVSIPTLTSLTIGSNSTYMESKEFSCPHRRYQDAVDMSDKSISTPNWFDRNRKKHSIEKFLRTIDLDYSKNSVNLTSMNWAKKNDTNALILTNRNRPCWAINKDYNIYHLLTINDIELESIDSEMHTIYRSTSEQSYVSG